MRQTLVATLVLAFAGSVAASAQSADSSRGNKTFFTRRDLVASGLALGATGILSRWDPKIARAAQKTANQDSSTHKLALRISKVNETTLTLGGIAVYGIARLTHNRLVTDVALHATESVVLASVASQLIRGPLGRTRPYVTNGQHQYDFHAFRGFVGDSTFDYRAFPSIHTSSSMAVATVLVMETNRHHPTAARVVAPFAFAAGILPGLARINLNQHWASDVAAGAFMGVLSGYKVVSYSHDHPNNRFDRMFLSASIAPGPDGRLYVSVNPSF